MDYLRTAESPEGVRYLVVMAPPGSALDAGGSAGGGPPPLAALALVLFRSMRRGWRIAVARCDVNGRMTGPVHRERVAGEHEAVARTASILARIRAGDWSG